MTTDINPNIIDQLQEIPKPEEWWWAITSAGFSIIKTNGAEDFIAIFARRKDVEVVVQRINAKKGFLRRIKEGKFLIYEAHLEAIERTYKGCKSTDWQDQCSRPFVGFAFCDSTGSVTEWRRWES